MLKYERFNVDSVNPSGSRFPLGKWENILVAEEQIAFSQ
jgi:hypothetical protein